jgi:hypothetical protein
MAGSNEGRSREAGGRDRFRRRRTQEILRRAGRWDVPDDQDGRVHRRSRVQQGRSAR